MNYFNLADWLVILTYLLGIIGLGVWFGKDPFRRPSGFVFLMGAMTITDQHLEYAAALPM